MFSEQRIRAVLFHLSVAVFFVGLPFILSFALGYKFDLRTFKFTKTGIISIKTQPPGAHIYLDSKLISEKSPATLNELLPGHYNVKIELDNYYPWSIQANVQPRKVTRIEKVILFPRRPNIKQLNEISVSSFYVDQDRKVIYYFSRQENVIYESDLEGERFKELSALPEGFNPSPKSFRLSMDKEKAALFNNHQICVLYLSHRGGLLYKEPLLLAYPKQKIIQVFWHSDNYHLILVTEKYIAVIEADSSLNEVTLVNLNKPPSDLFYDADKDTLYFSDYQMAPDGAIYENIYKLELSARHPGIANIIKTRQNGKE